ncbi:pseudouridine synthase [candidate division WOR-1 bacterium DG_54_3]|uniref:Pseudouridine synthase n=1 Tax=candidate division WOR-1 bacterium DG_54_3 TaxID=1703775 RepID=A0A0S7XRA4_UNCSA|nr:MAG: pseudouridine synthase [candidate division WOR-1 bacterium DG_54_3]
MPLEIRLHKYMAECGVASRRKAEKLILSGKVKVNDQVVTQLGTKIDPSSDKVIVNGKLLKRKEEKIYIKLNKPRGVVSAAWDPKETTVIDLVKDIPCRLYPVGRLDKNSEGLMILTNDGELANRLMHPRYEHEKEYIVNVECRITNDELRKLEEGVVIDERKTLPARVKRLGDKQFRIILREGKKRQIRRMLEAVGNKVSRLKRIRIKSIRLGNLATGKYAFLTTSEIQGLVL